jgi:tetratricopeptide (TPR) repeat protein
VDRPQPVALASPHSDTPLPEGTTQLGGAEASELREQLKQGNLEGLRAYLARTRIERDWQDRIFMLQLTVSSIRLPALDFACDTEPEAADLFLLRCAFFSGLALAMRGGGTCDQVTKVNFRNSAECIKAALAALEKAAKLDAQDPTAFAYILPCLSIFGTLDRWQHYAFQQATTLAPDLVHAYFTIVTRLSKRWGGSHEQSLDFARQAITKAGPGSDMAACLFRAHYLVWSHFTGFDSDIAGAYAYRDKPEVLRELEAAFDAWTQPPYAPRRSSIPFLHQAAYWFYVVDDRERLQRALSLTNNVFSTAGWGSGESGIKKYARAVLFANGEAPPSERLQNLTSYICLKRIADGIGEMQQGKFDKAEKLLSSVLQMARAAPPDESTCLVPLALFSLCLFHKKQGRSEEARKLRTQAIILLDAIDPDKAPLELATYHRIMAQVLKNLGEYRRAIPFWEQAIRLMEDDITPTKMADMLHHMGACYWMIGLSDHAAVPLRAAYKIFSDYPEDPRLPAVLVNLANCLRKNSPDEAEALYTESAKLHSERMQLQSVSAAWVNLGVLCSEQDRHAESLEFYQRALRVREQIPGTPPASIATVHNNIANCYRRMGKFSEAHESVNRAIQLLSANDLALPYAYGTRGLVFLDSGDDGQAVEWLRKAVAEQNNRPSPNLESMAEDLEKEIAALNKLGRQDEAAIAQQSLASVRSTIQAIAQSDCEKGSGKTQPEGAVLVELTFGSWPDRPGLRRNMTLLAESLSQIVREQDAGFYSSRVAMPENTTLIFYGPDAELLFRVLEPSLTSEPICAGARVVIRQGASHREIVVPSPSTTLN